MENKHKKVLSLGNHIGNMVGQPYYKRKPSDKKILDSILDGMSDFKGTCWAPEVKDGYCLMLHQCPGACGYVWSITIKDRSVVDWLVNEINQRRWGVNGKHKNLKLNN